MPLDPFLFTGVIHEEWKATVFSRDFFNVRRLGWKAVNGISVVTYRPPQSHTTACLRSSRLKMSVMNLLNWNQKVTKWLGKRKSSVNYQGQCKRRKKFRKGRWYRGVKDVCVIDSTYRLRNAGELDPHAGILFLYWNISIFRLKKAILLHHLRSQKRDSGILKKQAFLKWVRRDWPRFILHLSNSIIVSCGRWSS